ncbi:MAG TPA: DUF3108 domain-containing protein [Afipia sp.]|nr:DUF3108 domain-containing protein [Afipia sp.]HAO41076.1 DUF3108 domain-containing protein [Afipia sp.]HAP13027.1 DUF3108 domain-containing protein [Afipia sp.]HAQ94068.1 DUF3108 domain-containing protein [Afipia sp.]HBF54554.1 DUF3108 domain-containing protein [Afipia sp.]
MPRFPKLSWMLSRTAQTQLCLGIVAVAGLLAMCACPASAQGRLDAKYEATLAGLPIGKGAWVVDVSEDQYSAAVSGATTGLMKSIGGGNGTGTSQGRITAGQFAPLSYISTVNYGKKVEVIRITLGGGNIKDSSIEPKPDENPDRIPVTEAHRRNVLDPMTGALLKVAGTGDPVGPEACRKTLSVFDGRMRYDLRLEYKRMENVKAEKGYHGPVVVCAVYFTPIAGYVPDRASIKYVAAQRNMEIWFAPIAGTRVLAPFRITIPTPLGTGMIEATEFISVQKTAKTN